MIHTVTCALCGSPVWTSMGRVKQPRSEASSLRAHWEAVHPESYQALMSNVAEILSDLDREEV